MTESLKQNIDGTDAIILIPLTSASLFINTNEHKYTGRADYDNSIAIGRACISGAIDTQYHRNPDSENTNGGTQYTNKAKEDVKARGSVVKRTSHDFIANVHVDFHQHEASAHMELWN